jgi:hypothetical protein
MTSATKRHRLLLIGLLLIGLMVPPIFLSMVGQSAFAAPFVYGGAIALIALFHGRQLSLILSVAAGISGLVATLLSPYPVAGGIFFGLLTGAGALSARRGLHSPVLMVPVFIGFTLVAPPEVSGASLLVIALLAGAALAGGGLWILAVSQVLFGNSVPQREATPIGRATTLTYAALMALTLGVAAWGVMTFIPSHQGAWLLLTLIIVLQPSPHDTLVKSFQRLGGTILGGIVAVALILIGVDSTVALILGGAFLFAAMVVQFVFKRPYWEFVAVLTPAVILMDSPGRDGLQVAEERVGLTLLGGLIAIGIVVVIKAVLLWRAHRTKAA